MQVHSFLPILNIKKLSVILSFRSTFSTHKKTIYTYFPYLFSPEKDLLGICHNFYLFTVHNILHYMCKSSDHLIN
jgi:hypothetical protein